MIFTTVICVLIITFAFIGEAVFGFGGGLISVPLLALLIPIKTGINVVAIFQFLIGFLIFKNYKDIAWNKSKFFLLGMIPGTLLGTFLLKILSGNILSLILAALIISFLIKSYFFSNLVVSKENNFSASIYGLLFGGFQGSIGTGGPFLVIYYKKILPEIKAFRATLIMALSFSNLLRIIFISGSGLLDQEVIRLVVLSLPFFIIGILFGNKFYKTIPEALYKRIVDIILLISAISLIIKNT